MVEKAQKLQALRDFLEHSTFAHIDGHSMHDGPGCSGHEEAFTTKAEELLALIEEENYGYEPKLVATRSIQGGRSYESRDMRAFMRALTPQQLDMFGRLTVGYVFTLLTYDTGSTLVELTAADAWDVRQLELALEVEKNRA